MRDVKIDILRFIGLSMIILAHTHPPPLLFQLRNFDVPLMVFVSAMSYGLTHKKESYLDYIWKRLKRLVLPIWLYLTIYFLLLFTFNNSSIELNVKTIFSSYLLVNGIGYVWIIRVFLLVALVAPFIHKAIHCNRSPIICCMFLLILLITYEFLREHTSAPQIFRWNYISLILNDIIPYSLIFAYGLLVKQMSYHKVREIAFFLIIIFIGQATFLYHRAGHLVPTQAYKYPPSSYYILYSLAVSTLLYSFSEILESIVKRKVIILKLLLFIQ